MRRLPVWWVLSTLTLLVLAEPLRIAIPADDPEPSCGGKQLSEWVKGLTSEGVSTVYATSSVLRRVTPKELPSVITELLVDKNREVRHAAAKALRKIDPEAAKRAGVL